MSEDIPELKEMMDVPDKFEDMPKVYLVWSINRVSHEIELCSVTSDRKRAKKYARQIRKDRKLRSKQIRTEIESRQINHLFGGDMMGDGKEWNKKSGKGLESKIKEEVE